MCVLIFFSFRVQHPLESLEETHARTVLFIAVSYLFAYYLSVYSYIMNSLKVET